MVFTNLMLPLSGGASSSRVLGGQLKQQTCIASIGGSHHRDQSLTEARVDDVNYHYRENHHDRPIDNWVLSPLDRTTTTEADLANPKAVHKHQDTQARH